MNKTNTHMHKKLLLFCSALLALLLLAETVCLPARAYAATIVDSGSCGQNAIWSLDSDGTLIIKPFNEEAKANMYFYSRDSVPWDLSRSQIKKVVIETGITNIGYDAFDSCTGLTSVLIPDSVSTIDSYAFYGCTRLKNVTIPDSVTSIGSNAFFGCTGLTSISIPNSMEYINYRSFSGCTGLTSMTIPNSVKTIDYEAFCGCSGLKSVTIPNSVTSIGGFSFYGCTGLTSITIPNSVTSIGKKAFHDTAWYHAQPDGLVYAGKVAYKYKGTMPENTAIKLKKGTLGIADDAFSDCSGMTSITIPNSVITLGVYELIFERCKNISDVYYEGSEADWNKISGADEIKAYLPNAIFHYNSTGPEEPAATHTVSFNANGGTRAPAAQTITEGAAFSLSSETPVKEYTLTCNANSGTVSNASITVNAAFLHWNTKPDGSGTAYAPGDACKTDADLTLYAQWGAAKAGSLPVPTRAGSAFTGWFTAADGGEQITEESTITKSQTLYAHWNNPYNLGEETYGFANYTDNHNGSSENQHCNGMSMTSAGYYLGLLDVRKIGLDSPQDLHSATMTKNVTDPICNYQAIQGTYLSDAIVSGDKGTIGEQWQAAVNYVKDHAYDGKGALTITIRTVIDGAEYGHALVFLRYENVNGQDRIYAYDCETPDTETYFYLTSTGVRQGPDNAAYAGFDINKAFALNDVAAYFENAKRYQPGRVIYARSGEITVDGALVSTMVGKIGDTPWMMYELPADAAEAKITAQKIHATFSYMNREYTVDNTDGDPYMLLPLNKIHQSGDVSGDGKITAEDARFALRATVGLEHYEKDSAEFLAADADKSGTLEAADARLILRAAVGLETLD